MKPPRNGVPALFVGALTLSATAVFLQAVTAGMFVSQDGRDSWVSVHGVIADVTWVAALIAAAVALARLRRVHHVLTIGSALLFVLTLGQTGIGHLITDKGMDGLIVVHVPLAVVIVAVATLLLVEVVRARRSLVPVEPYADEQPQDLPVANRR
jgi:hypothetical protein